VWYEQEIGFLRSLKFDIKARVKGLHIDQAWAILRQRWVAAHVLKREHTTPQALEAANGKWATVYLVASLYVLAAPVHHVCLAACVCVCHVSCCASVSHNVMLPLRFPAAREVERNRDMALNARLCLNCLEGGN
jgi:hypothetical protein